MSYKPFRSPLKYPGGKAYLARRFVKRMAPHEVFVEACFGGGSMTFACPPKLMQGVANDIDTDLMNFWHVLKTQGQLLGNMLAAYSKPCPEIWAHTKIQLNRQYHETRRVERAVAYFIKTQWSRGGAGQCYLTESKRLRRGMPEHVSSWLSRLERLLWASARLRTVCIRSLPLIELIDEYDSPDTLFYFDPPYYHTTRNATKLYKHEMSHQNHVDLLARLAKIEGRFMLSGYDSKLYQRYAKTLKWRKLSYKVANHMQPAGKEKRTETECLWMNYYGT